MHIFITRMYGKSYNIYIRPTTKKGWHMEYSFLAVHVHTNTNWENNN